MNNSDAKHAYARLPTGLALRALAMGYATEAGVRKGA